MHLSLNEIEATSKRATRGAGRSWGMAEEGAKAVRSLHEIGLPGVRLLATLLQETDCLPQSSIAPTLLKGDWQGESGLLCPLATGATMSDIAPEIAAGREVRTRALSCPLLLVPFAIAIAHTSGKTLRLQWADVTLDAHPDGVSRDLTNENLLARRAETMTCRTVETGVMAAGADPLHNVDPDDWELLNAFAFRTFAPESEASRRKGAGSSLPDND
ncbi:MAG: DUF3726 domain-containing protein [Nitratireductor sp.]|nr:DUF3726 domain-containing protein [Nitratireductor sp.]